MCCERINRETYEQVSPNVIAVASFESHLKCRAHRHPTTRTHARAHTHTHTHTHICICIHVYIYIYTYIHTYLHTNVDIYILIYIYIFICIHIHMHVCVCVWLSCVCVCVSCRSRVISFLRTTNTTEVLFITEKENEEVRFHNIHVACIILIRLLSQNSQHVSRFPHGSTKLYRVYFRIWRWWRR
jgi:hypothetical protein